MPDPLRPPQMVYLIGAPGSGKSTLFSELTKDLNYTPVSGDVPHVIWTGKYAHVIELGKRRDSFSGTDALSMSIQPKVIEFLKDPGIHKRIMAEGDRLTNLKFFQAVEEAGWLLQVFWLDTPKAILEDRRSLRTMRGEVQNRTWLRGRDSKIANIVQQWPTVRIPGDKSVEEQADIMQLKGLSPIKSLGRNVASHV